MISLFKKSPNEEGQGLVEYALILVLVAIVVIAILLLLGPAVSQVYCQVANTLKPGSCGVITSVSAARTGNGNGNDVVVTITVSKNASVTAADSQSGQSKSTTCNGSCTVTLTGVGDSAGKATVTDDKGGIMSTSYNAKN